MLTRRKFMGRIAGAAAASAGISSFLAPFLPSCSGGNRLEKFGFISGIIGKELEGDWKGILKQAAGFGFSEIEIGDYLGDSAAGFLDYCREIGLTPVAGGIDFDPDPAMAGKRIDALKALELEYAVTYWPWLTGGPFTLDDCRRSADILNKLGLYCSQKGLTFCWHNHNKEFIPTEGGMPFDFLMEHTDPALVKCEMDIYWVRKGGADPLALLRKYRGRIPILHVKDMAPGPEEDFECPGSGIIDFPALFREARSQGIEHFMVERDNVPDGMACLQSSGTYLKNLRW